MVGRHGKAIDMVVIVTIFLITMIMCSVIDEGDWRCGGINHGLQLKSLAAIIVGGDNGCQRTFCR